MGIRESLLNTITSVSNGDFIRVVTSAGASSKATLQNVMKSFETGLGAKSSLTTSDYIRVVGSDDVSYKQSVSNVRTALGIGASASYSSLASFYAEFASMEVNTKYFVTFYDACSTALGLPSATYKGYVSKSTSTICDMTVQWYSASSGALSEYIGRVIFDGSGNVTATYWTKQPTRTEVDKMASTTGTVSNLDSLVPFTTGYATFDASVSPTGASGAFWYSVIGWGTNARTEITCVDVSGTVYTKVKDYSGWKAWVKQPTRAEMDKISGAFVQLSTEIDPDEAINGYADTLPADSHAFIRILGTRSGHKIAVIQKFGNANYASVLEWDYWNGGDGIRLHQKTNGTWRVEKLPTRAEVNSLNKMCKRVTASSSAPAKVPCAGTANYATFTVSGLAQGIGSVLLAVVVSGGSIQKVRDLTTNTDFSNSNLTFSYSSGELTISSTNASDSLFTVVCG